MPREQYIQSRILKELKKRGIWAVKVINASRSGTPDILACHQGKFLAIEVKRPDGGRVSVLQQIQIDRINACQGIALVATCWDDVEKVLS
jgi:Holliday junction resolvase